MKYLVFSLSILFSIQTFGQSILNASSPEEYRKLRDENKKLTSSGDTIQSFSDPLPYGFIEEKDELWSKVTWEVIDLNERLNQVYHHNSDGLVSGNISLFEAIKEGVRSGEIKEVYDDEYFKVKSSAETALGRLQNTRVDEVGIEDMLNAGEELSEERIANEFTDTFEVNNDEVQMMMIKGIWYIDKRLGEMRYRLLGIAMLGPDAATIGRGIEGGDELLPLFWIWYPDARKTLSKYRAFNDKNNSTKVSYDDLLNARMFNSIIYKTEKLGTGTIEEYLPEDSEAQLREGLRIKHNILEIENQMWNY